MGQSNDETVAAGTGSGAVGGVAVRSSAAASIDDQEHPPHYLKLIADCWEHIFDNLALSDILAMGQTCKRMLQMAGWNIFRGINAS